MIVQNLIRFALPLLLIISLVFAWDRPPEPDYPVLTPKGLQGAVYFMSNGVDRLPDFDHPKDHLERVGTIYTNPLYVDLRDYTDGFPCIVGRFEWFAIDYKATIYISKPGDYRFYLASDDGSKLSLDGKVLINNDSSAGSYAVDHSIKLSTGLHRLRLSYYQGRRYHLGLTLSVAAPGDHDLKSFDAAAFIPPAQPEAIADRVPPESLDIATLINTVRAALRQHTPDSSLADSLQKVTLRERLDPHPIEELESEGAGPETLAALDSLREISARQPEPATAPMFQSPPRPTVDEQRQIFRQVSSNAMRYTGTLPDFLATEVIHRYTQAPNCPSIAPQSDALSKVGATGPWQPKDVLTVKLSYFSHREKYDLILVNGKKADRDYESSGGAISEGDFGTTLLETFSPDTETKFQWDHWTHLRKRLTHVFSYRTLPEHSHYKIVVGRKAVVAGRHGFVYADAETNMVMRITGDADSIPPAFPVTAESNLLDYAMADVGGRQFLLPLRAEQRMEAGQRKFKNIADFRDYRKFIGESTISFGDPEPARNPDK